MKATLKNLVAKKTFIIKTLVIAGVIIATLPSCKHQEDCGAYQGSHKSTRSHKKHKRHSGVIVIDRTLRA